MPEPERPGARGRVPWRCPQGRPGTEKGCHTSSLPDPRAQPRWPAAHLPTGLGDTSLPGRHRESLQGRVPPTSPLLAAVTRGYQVSRSLSYGVRGASACPGTTPPPVHIPTGRAQASQHSAHGRSAETGQGWARWLWLRRLLCREGPGSGSDPGCGGRGTAPGPGFFPKPSWEAGVTQRSGVRWGRGGHWTSTRVWPGTPGVAGAAPPSEMERRQGPDP